MTPAEHNKHEFLKDLEESKKRNKDFDYLFGDIISQIFQAIEGAGDFKAAFLARVEERLPAVYVPRALRLCAGVELAPVGLGGL